MEDKVSVIVPVYNVEHYLNKCLDSIVNQTYRNLEIILVDDGSTDSSGKICDKYAETDDRIKVIHKNNQGQAVARNYALDIATGSYIAFVDSDDYILKDMIKIMVEAMKDRRCEVCICGVKFRRCRGIEKDFSFVTQRVQGTVEQLMEKYLMHKVTTTVWNKIYKAELFEGIRFPMVRCREDVYILHEVLGKCKEFIEIPDCLYVQNVREGSTERKKFNEQKLNVTYEALSRQREYVKTKYPQYYRYTELLLADVYYKALLEIVVKNNIKIYNELYNRILSGFKKELRKIKIDELSSKNRNDYKKMIWKAEHHRCLYLGLKFKRIIWLCKMLAINVLTLYGGE